MQEVQEVKRVEDDYLPMHKAALILEVSRYKVWKLVKEGRLQAYSDPLDDRVKLVRRKDLEELLRKVPLGVNQDEQGKGT